jgi:hypothetical protein
LIIFILSIAIILLIVFILFNAIIL